MSRRPESWLIALIVALASIARVGAHSGPPFPIVTNQIVDQYDISIWTDPDATDDDAKGGQFWVVLKPHGPRPIPADTQVWVSILAMDRPGSASLEARAVPVDGLVTRQFAALRMDHEGRFSVHVIIHGPLGPAEVMSAVDATYDLRPPPVLFVVYLVPFVVLGLFWVKLLRRRRALARGDVRPPVH